MNPKLKGVLWPLISAILGALASYFATGCTPAQVDKVNSAVDEAQAQSAKVDCVQDALRHYDVLTHPEHTTLEDAAGLSLALKACLSSADAPDAGN